MLGISRLKHLDPPRDRLCVKIYYKNRAETIIPSWGMSVYREAFNISQH